MYFSHTYSLKVILKDLFTILFFERQTGGKQRCSSCCFTPQVTAIAALSSLEHNAGLLQGWNWCKYLSTPPLLPRVRVSRMLHLKWSSWDTSWALYKGGRHIKWQLNCCTKQPPQHEGNLMSTFSVLAVFSMQVSKHIWKVGRQRKTNGGKKRAPKWCLFSKMPTMYSQSWELRTQFRPPLWASGTQSF